MVNLIVGFLVRLRCVRGFFLRLLEGSCSIVFVEVFWDVIMLVHKKGFGSCVTGGSRGVCG